MRVLGSVGAVGWWAGERVGRVPAGATSQREMAAGAVANDEGEHGSLPP